MFKLDFNLNINDCFCFRTNRNNQLPPNARVLGSVICVGDFCDGYDMPQPLIKPVGKKKDENTVSSKFMICKHIYAELSLAFERPQASKRFRGCFIFIFMRVNSNTRP